MLVYNLSIHIYGLAVRIAALFIPKAAQWVEGRKSFFKDLPVVEQGHVIWFHCASLGEFEQGRPIIESWKKKYPDHFILLTFFSPSGYEVRKNYEFANHCCYLPLDTPSNARKFIAHFQPKIAFFVKYEFWLNYIESAQKTNCKLYSISTLLNQNHRFFKWYGGVFRKGLTHFQHFFVQDEQTKHLLATIGIDSVTRVGDTRYDRVNDRVKEQNTNEYLKNWIAPEDKVLVVGSSWKEDEEILIPYINGNNHFDKVIFAPHEVNETNVNRILSELQVTVETYTHIQQSGRINETTQVVILNCIGVLADAYQYGTIAYVGGAFKTGLHNILEPATFGLPVLFGPHYAKFPEASMFISAGIGTAVQSMDELRYAMQTQLGELEQLQPRVKEFVASQIGARERIMQWFEKN